MTKRISERLAKAFCQKGIFSSEDTAIYAYGLELLLATILNVTVLVIISIVISKPLAWGIFLLSFIPIRLTAGGYHAPTHLTCGLIFCTSFAFLTLFAILINETVGPVTLIFFSMVCLLITAIFSPIQSSNKPQTEQQLKINRRRSIFISIISTLITSICLFTGRRFILYLSVFVMGQALAAASLMIAWIMGSTKKQKSR